MRLNDIHKGGQGQGRAINLGNCMCKWVWMAAGWPICQERVQSRPERMDNTLKELFEMVHNVL